MDVETRKRLLELVGEIQKEHDSAKVLKLIREINSLLENDRKLRQEKEQKTA